MFGEPFPLGRDVEKRVDAWCARGRCGRDGGCPLGWNTFRDAPSRVRARSIQQAKKATRKERMSERMSRIGMPTRGVLVSAAIHKREP